MTLTVQFLPARQGDAIWLSWGDEVGPRHRAIIDMGTFETGRALAERLRNLPANEREIELLVVTHVDNDHIGGVISCLVDPDSPVAGVRFNDVWFNGFPHLDGKRIPPPKKKPTLEGMGVAQGQQLADWLAQQPWNAHFGGGPVVRDGAPVQVTLPGGLRLTVLGPTPARLAALKPSWPEEVDIALTEPLVDQPGGGHPGLEGFGPTEPPTIEDEDDLRTLADERFKADAKAPNGTSIALLVEWRGRRLFLTGDAFASDLVEGLAALNEHGRVKLDLLKLPHHGSRNNVSKALVAAVECPEWVVSSDGSQFRHPDPQALARILAGGVPSPRTLGFNVPSMFALWWDDPTWRDIGQYQTRYGDALDGLTYTFEPVTKTTSFERPQG